MDPDRLQSVPLLSELPSGDRAAVATVARETRAEAGDVLVRDGDFRYELIAIEVGEAELYRGGELVERLGEGDVVGEIGNLERHVGRLTVIASSDMELITLSALDVRRLRCTAPVAVARMQGMLLRRRRRVAG